MSTPAPDLAEFAEAVTLECIAALGGGHEPAASEAVSRWLTSAGTPDHPAWQLAELVRCLDLGPASSALVTLLAAHALSEPVAREVAAADSQGRGGMPVWLAKKLIPELREADLASGCALSSPLP